MLDFTLNARKTISKHQNIWLQQIYHTNDYVVTLNDITAALKVAQNLIIQKSSFAVTQLIIVLEQTSQCLQTSLRTNLQIETTINVYIASASKMLN